MQIPLKKQLIIFCFFFVGNIFCFIIHKKIKINNIRFLLYSQYRETYYKIEHASPVYVSVLQFICWETERERESSFQVFCPVCVFFSSTMSLLSDLLNLNLSDSTEKVIAEYIWSAPFSPFPSDSPSVFHAWTWYTYLCVFVRIFVCMQMGLLVLMNKEIGWLWFCVLFFWSTTWGQMIKLCFVFFVKIFSLSLFCCWEISES